MNKHLKVQEILEKVLIGIDWKQSLVHDFHPQYRQWVDGKELNYQEFCAHIHWLRNQAHITSITFDQLLCQQETVFSCHNVSGYKINGHQFTIRVMALFEFLNEQIIRTNEMSCVIKGDAANRNLAKGY